MSLRNSVAETSEPDFLKEFVDDQEFEDSLTRMLVLAGLLDPPKVFPHSLPQPPPADMCGPGARKARPLSKPGHRTLHP